MSNNDLPGGIVLQSSVDRAIEGMNEKRGNRVTRGISPEKAQLSTKIVNNSINNLLVSLSQPRCNKTDLDEIRSRTVDFLQRCADSQCIPLIEDWAVALGVNRATLYRWFDNPGTPEIGEFLERVRTSIYAANAQAAYQSTINPVSWIFYAKNSLGMSDKTEISVSANNRMDDTEYISQEELRRKYLDAVDAGNYEEVTEV